MKSEVLRSTSFWVFFFFVKAEFIEAIERGDTDTDGVACVRETQKGNKEHEPPTSVCSSSTRESTEKSVIVF